MLFETESHRAEDEAESAGTVTVRHLGSLFMARIAGPALTLRRTDTTIARGAADHYMVQLLLDGNCTGTAGNGTNAMRSGDVGILDLGRPLAIETTAFEALAFVIPRHALTPLVRAPEALHGLVLPADSAVGMLVSEHLRTFDAQLPALSTAAAMPVAVGTAGLIAACFASVLDVRGLANEPQRALLDRIKSFIEVKLDAPDLGATVICDSFGLSRSALYRLFEPLGGVSKHIRDRRLARALDDLVTPGPDRLRIVDIAYRWGFGSEASFSRAFRAGYGMSPGEARETAEYMRRTALKDSAAMERVLHRGMHSLTAQAPQS